MLVIVSIIIVRVRWQLGNILLLNVRLVVVVDYVDIAVLWIIIFAVILSREFLLLRLLALVVHCRFDNALSAFRSFGESGFTVEKVGVGVAAAAL